MDKSWIFLRNRTDLLYREGAKQFIKFAFEGLGPSAKTSCPCRKCYFREDLPRDVMHGHIVVNGFIESYTTWTYHGEKMTIIEESDGGGNEVISDAGDDMVGMVHDMMGVPPTYAGLGEGLPEQAPLNQYKEGMDDETSDFFKMLKAAMKPLFKGCKRFTSLSFIIRLLHIKVLGGMTNKCCTLILELLHEAFKELGELQLAKSYYEANKITEKLGYDYQTWDACPNNCMLFRNEHKDLDKCIICQTSRYKESKNNTFANDDIVIKKGKRTAAKQVRYFPLKPRLKRLFRSSHTASLMTWHSDERVDDGVMRHPADSPAWKSFDQRFPSFASDNRNVRFALAADGFNPFKTFSSTHSTWPVLLVPYNLPPWECMKQHSFILSVLIDGPNGPGDHIDVYMQPLIEELKELWSDGIYAYDAHRNEMFTLRAALMWTISDFPALSSLMGYAVKGPLGCPSCLHETKCFRLKHGGKYCYWGHRRWLRKTDKFRRDKNSFDGKQEWGTKPKTLSGSEILQQLKDVETVYKIEDVLQKKKREECEIENEKERKAQLRREKRKQREIGKSKKANSKRRQTNKRLEGACKHGFKKKSIFFELPYWEHNLLRHNLDVMHIEKNVCDNILYTILGVKGKTKDNPKSRLDLQEMNIRKPLHFKQGGTSGKKVMPASCFTMTRKEKKIFLKTLKNVRVPDGYASNISRCVNLDKLSISGLKSHDNHILMQQLLPIALRKALPNKDVVEALIELSKFFRQLCSKMNKITDLEYIQDRIAVTLCKLEKIFPPSFFDIMEHLPIHLVDEALLAGAVMYRWMYPIERYLSTLKGYVRNQARPEGSIAKGYQMEECMTFCARYLHDVESKSNRPNRNDTGKDFSGRHFGQVNSFNLDDLTREQIHRYVLANIDSVQPYMKDHLAYLKERRPRASDRDLQRIHNEEFPTWFNEHVVQKTIAKEELPDEIKELALGPNSGAQRYKGYIINGFRFRTESSDNSKVSQNCGVGLNLNSLSHSSSLESDLVSSDVFYGKLTDIIEVVYSGGRNYVMFKCDWVDKRKGLRVDRYKFTTVNFKHLLYKDNKATDEPFILASQAQQVMYIQDQVDTDWHVVVQMTSRDTFDMGVDDGSGATTEVPQPQPFPDQQLEDTVQENDDSTWVRHDVEGVTITFKEGRASEQTKRLNLEENNSDDEEDIGSDEMEVDAIDVDEDEWETDDGGGDENDEYKSDEREDDESEDIDVEESDNMDGDN